MSIISVGTLRSCGACAPQIERFCEVFGDFTEVTEGLAEQYACTFNFEWAGESILHGKRKNEFIVDKLIACREYVDALEVAQAYEAYAALDKEINRMEFEMHLLSSLHKEAVDRWSEVSKEFAHLVEDENSDDNMIAEMQRLVDAAFEKTDKYDRQITTLSEQLAAAEAAREAAESAWKEEKERAEAAYLRAIARAWARLYNQQQSEAELAAAK